MKRRIITIITMMLIMFLIILSYNQNNEKSFTQDGVIYAATFDGNSINYFPDKGDYKVNVNCTNATGKWLYDDWKLVIKDITNKASCDIDFTTITNKEYLNDYIIGLTGIAQGTGQVVNENGYRYEGKNPNNYMWFNNELWRIIGVFNETSQGQTGVNLVKIIRNQSIGGLTWNKSWSNNWKESSLKALLNGAYLNALDGTESEYCYGYSSYVKANCDYSEIGIQEIYRGMIKEVTWFLGGSSTNNATAEEFYGYERGTTVYDDTRPTSVQAHIGLMYPSDYGYSVLSSSCGRYRNLNGYCSSECGGQSWLYGQGYEWTLTPDSSSSGLMYNLGDDGNLSGAENTYPGWAVRPVLYLDSSVYRIEGDGSILNPYIIAM